MSLDQILSQLFVDKEVPLLLLRKYNLQDILNKGILAVKAAMDKQPLNSSSMREIAASILVAVNSKLGGISDPSEKQHIELILRDIAQHLLEKKIIPSSNQPGELIRDVRSSLETTAAIHDYNSEALFKVLKLDQIEAKFPTIQKSNGIYHYEWLGKLHHLDELSNNLKHEKTILSVKDFKKLFEKHDNPLLKVQFEKQSLHFLLALFDELRNRKLLLPKGNKGHFHPLKAYGVDFENNILIKKSPKTIKFTAKKNAEKWEKHVNKAKSWTGGFKL